MKKPSKQLMVFLLVVAVTSALCLWLYYTDNKYEKPGLQGAEGLLAVSQEALAAQPVNHLIYGWAFYPDVLLGPEDFAAGNPADYMVYTAIGQRTRLDTLADSSPHGCGSYFMRLRLPKEVQTYAMEVPEIFSAYRLYVGGRLVLQMGEPERAGYTPRTQSRIVTFDAAEKTSILLAVSDYSHFYSGMVYPISFGTPQAVTGVRSWRMGISLFFNTLALLAGALALYFGLRMGHKNALLFCLLCIATCGFTAYPLLHGTFALPIFPWYGLELFCGYLLPLLVVVLHNHICGIAPHLKRTSTTVAATVCGIALIYGLGSSRLTVPMIEGFSALVFLYKGAFAAYLLATALGALRHRNRQAAPLFYASVLYATTFVWDRILPNYEPILGGWLIEWGSLALVAAIGYTLWRDITTAFADNLAFAEEHRLMERQLAMQTEYARQLHQRGEETRRLTHDFRQHLRTVTGLSRQVHSTPETLDKQAELLDYLEEIAQTTPVHPTESTSFCQNIALDALLQYYDAAAHAGGISTDFRLVLPSRLTLSDVELCTVLGNLLENSVEACKGTSGTYIRISTEQTAYMLLILVENSYDGHYRQEGDRFVSRKHGETRFGIGLESVRNIIERHGGTLDIFPLKTKFRVGISLPLRRGE